LPLAEGFTESWRDIPNDKSSVLVGVVIRGGESPVQIHAVLHCDAESPRAFDNFAERVTFFEETKPG